MAAARRLLASGLASVLALALTTAPAYAATRRTPTAKPTPAVQVRKAPHHPAAADLPAHSVEGQPHRTAEHHDPRPVHDPCHHDSRRRPALDHRAGARP